MQLSKNQKILLGILTFLPFVLFAYFFFSIFRFIVEMSQLRDQASPEDVFPAIFSFVTPIIFASLLTLGLLVFYIIHAVQNKGLDSTERVVWILLFVFLGNIAFPIYFFMRLKSRDDLEKNVALDSSID